jgi:hypothetical protein
MVNKKIASNCEVIGKPFFDEVIEQRKKSDRDSTVFPK